MLQVAYFLLVLVPWQEHPAVYGPYTREECHWELEFLDRRGWEESECTLLPVPQAGAVRMEPPYLPVEEQ